MGDLIKMPPPPVFVGYRETCSYTYVEPATDEETYAEVALPTDPAYNSYTFTVDPARLPSGPYIDRYRIIFAFGGRNPSAAGGTPWIKGVYVNNVFKGSYYPGWRWVGPDNYFAVSVIFDVNSGDAVEIRYNNKSDGVYPVNESRRGIMYAGAILHLPDSHEMGVESPKSFTWTNFGNVEALLARIFGFRDLLLHSDFTSKYVTGMTEPAVSTGALGFIGYKWKGTAADYGVMYPTQLTTRVELNKR